MTILKKNICLLLALVLILPLTAISANAESFSIHSNQSQLIRIDRRATTLTVTKINIPSIIVESNRENVNLLKFKLQAKGRSDLKLKNLTVAFGGLNNGNIISTAKLYDANGNLLDASIPNNGTVVFKPSYIIRANKSRNLTVKVDLKEGASGTINAYIKKNNWFTAIDLNTDNNVKINGQFPIMGQSMSVVIMENGELNVTPDTSTPQSQTFTSGQEDVVVSRFNLTASNEDINLRRLVLNFAGLFANPLVDNVYINFAGETANYAGILDPNNNVSFDNLNYTVQRGTSKTIEIRVDISELASAGSQFKVGIKDLLATGASSGYNIPIQSLPLYGNMMSIINVQSTGELTVSLSANTPYGDTLSQGQSNVSVLYLDLSENSVEAAELKDISFNITGLNSQIIDRAELVDLSSGMVLGEILVSNETLSFGNVDFIIPENSTRQLALVLNISPVATGTFQIRLNAGNMLVEGTNSAENLNIRGSFPINGNPFTILQ